MTLGRTLTKSFQNLSIGAKGEIALFRALIQTFNSLGQAGLAKEYHGSRYQVSFHQKRGAGRKTPRCELCDVLFIHYPASNPSAARLTLNQAKVSSKEFDSRATAYLSKSYNFRANLEQWDLLSNRPYISPATRTFLPPQNLLADALLPSVGTFGVFYPVGAMFDFAYFIADSLHPLKNGQARSGTLQWSNSKLVTRTIGGYGEVTGAGSLQKFGDALENGLVGTPIKDLLSHTKINRGIRPWIAGLLRELARDNRESELPLELLEGLELQSRIGSDAVPIDFADSRSIKAAILIRT